MQKNYSFSYAKLGDIVQKIRSDAPQAVIFTFTGPLGAGKTTMVKKLLETWGIDSYQVTSPTFAYVNKYSNSQGMVFYHFDLYRLSTADEFVSHGFHEYLYQSNSIVLIEWPAPILPLIERFACHLILDYGLNPDERTVKISIQKDAKDRT
jgi:tRNA threonylcarbamoyladenosine biosynthesis protein TsaE